MIPRPTFMNRMIDVEQTKVLKAMMALAIVIHHISYELHSLWALPLRYIGAVIVATFFFLSGYGLEHSLYNKPNYLKNFVTNRVALKLLLPAFIVFLMALLAFGNYDFSQHFLRLTMHGLTIVPNAWFVYAILVMYMLFYLGARIPIVGRTALMLICISLYMLHTMHNGFPRNWFVTILAFPLGMLIYHYQDFILRNKTRVFLTVLCAGALMFAMRVDAGKCIMFAISPILVILTFTKFNISKISRYRAVVVLSAISYEIYLTHGLVISKLSNHIQADDHALVFIILVYGLSIPIALATNRFASFISSFRFTAPKHA